MTEPLLSLATFEAYRDGEPIQLLNAAAQEVRSYCGWHIAPEVTETVTVEGLGAALLLPTLHLTGITSITHVDSETPLTLDYVHWWPNGKVTGYAFSGEYEVTFTHGHAVTPDDVGRVVAAIAGDGIEGLRRVKSWARGPFSETYEDGGADSDRAVLDRYKIASGP